MTNFFQNNLKFLRKQNGKSQTDVAFQLKKAHTSIGNYEKGISEPTISEITILSQYFGISVDDLINKDLSNTKILENEENTKNEGNTKKNTKIYTKISPQTGANASVVGVVCSNCQQLQNIVVEKDKLIQSQQQTIQSQQQTVQALQLATTQLQQMFKESEYQQKVPKKGAA
jgi:transcriptional regulator with XRE-family HTH domain